MDHQCLGSANDEVVYASNRMRSEEIQK